MRKKVPRKGTVTLTAGNRPAAFLRRTYGNLTNNSTAMSDKWIGSS